MTELASGPGLAPKSVTLILRQFRDGGPHRGQGEPAYLWTLDATQPTWLLGFTPFGALTGNGGASVFLHAYEKPRQAALQPNDQRVDLNAG